MRRVLTVVAVFLLVCSLTVPSALAKGSPAERNVPDAKTQSAHTITWWCVDLNDLWHVDVPVIAGPVYLVLPDPSPIPDPCTTSFPVTVPNGSAFMPGGGDVWATNKTYPAAVRAALETIGYNFHSQSPAEDFISKMVAIRVEIRMSGDTGDGVPVAEFRSGDPRQNFRLVQWRQLNGPLPIDPIVDPALGIDISSAEGGRLPTFAFTTLAGPVPPGSYRAWIYWTLSDLHNDGLGLLDEDFLPAGEFLTAFPRFIVLE